MKKNLLLLAIICTSSLKIFSQGPPPPCGYNPLYQCDINSDGIAEFNLVEWSPFSYCNILVDPSDYQPNTYYLTQADATNNINAISNPANFINTTNPQILYMRTEAINPTGTYDILIGEDIIEAVAPPLPSTATDLIKCDLYGTGFSSFSFSEKNAEILGSQNALRYGVWFFETYNDALNLTNRITGPYTNTTAYQQTIYASLHILLENECSQIIEFDLLLQGECTNEAQDLFECAPGLVFTAEFDLTVNDSSMIGNQTDVVVTYHESQTDAENGTNAISTPSSYTNIDSPDVIYARIENTVNGQYEVTPFNIQVHVLPENNTPPDLEVCDDDLDGFTGFDLEVQTPIIPDGLVVVDVTYHLTEADAINGVNSLVSPYINISNPQTIYARSTNLNNSTVDFFPGCYAVTSFDIKAIDCTDSENDGVNDMDEDINGNGNLDDDDTDLDGIPNYLDDDDDGDNVDTAIEIADSSSRAMHAFVDTDNDMIENYLDDDDDGDGILTINEDYNGNGDVTDDDINMNGIPDYLDNQATLSVSNLVTFDFKIYPNPSSDQIYIETQNLLEDYYIEVFNTIGKLILNTKNTSYIDVSSLQSGIYFVKLKHQNDSSIKKLIIN